MNLINVRTQYDDNILLINHIIVSHNIKSILDIGCGNAHYHKFINCRGITGIDISDNLPESDNYFKHSVEKFPYPFDRKFDLVIALDVIEHLYNPLSFISNISNYIKKFFYISVPNKLCIDDILLNRDISVLSKDNLKHPRFTLEHIRFFTPQSIVELLSDYYDIELVTGSNVFASEILSNLINSISSSFSVNPLELSRIIGSVFVNNSPNISILCKTRRV